jgi:hypothetical protein
VNGNTFSLSGSYQLPQSCGSAFAVPTWDAGTSKFDQCSQSLPQDCAVQDTLVSVGKIWTCGGQLPPPLFYQDRPPDTTLSTGTATMIGYIDLAEKANFLGTNANSQMMLLQSEVEVTDTSGYAVSVTCNGPNGTISAQHTVIEALPFPGSLWQFH